MSGPEVLARLLEAESALDTRLKALKAEEDNITFTAAAEWQAATSVYVRMLRDVDQHNVCNGNGRAFKLPFEFALDHPTVASVDQMLVVLRDTYKCTFLPCRNAECNCHKLFLQ
jgi:uncharacterized protein YxjI